MQFSINFSHTMITYSSFSAFFSPTSLSGHSVTEFHRYLVTRVSDSGDRVEKSHSFSWELPTVQPQSEDLGSSRVSLGFDCVTLRQSLIPLGHSFSGVIISNLSQLRKRSQKCFNPHKVLFESEEQRRTFIQHLLNSRH